MLTLECPSCGARTVEGMEGGEYTSHYHDCPYRRTFGEQRRTVRDRGGDLIHDARRKFAEINWWIVVGAIVAFMVVGFLMSEFFDWYAHWERAR